MLTHMLAVAFAGFVAFTARPGMPDSTLFSWHPTLMTAAFTFLAAEGVLMLSRKSTNRVTAHLILMLLAGTSAVLGFLAIYTTKEKYGKEHFVTPHAKLGTGTVAYILMQLCAGLSLLFPQLINKVMDVRQVRRMHGLSGTLLLLLATLTLIGGVTTDWFKERVTGPTWYACVVTPLFIYASLAKQVLSSKPAADAKKRS